jgi:hypothetical protein
MSKDTEMPNEPDEKIDVLSLVLIETAEGLFAAENIYDGSDDFFSADASAAYEYDDGRSDAYPLNYASYNAK